MKTVGELLNEIQSNELVLPEFQREFEWSKKQSKSLITSLYDSYPIGSVLRWKTENPPAIKNDAIDRTRGGLHKVLLDGQQRLTVLYLLIKDDIPPYYEQNELDHDPRDLCFNINSEDFQYENKQLRESPEWVRVTNCFTNNVDDFDIADEVTENDREFKKLKQIYESNLDRLCEIENRQIPIQNLGKEADVHEAIEVFDRINTEGTDLNKGQITLAHMSAQWPHIRRNIKQKQIELADRGFEFDIDFYVQCMVAVTTGSMAYERTYNKEKEELKGKWESLSDDGGVFDFLFNILEEEAYIPDSSYLSSRAVLIPLIVYLESKKDIEMSREEKNELFRWMYLALMWGRYSGSSETDLEHDLSLLDTGEIPADALINEIRDGRDINVKPSDIAGKRKQSSFYQMLKIVTRANNPIDWKTGEPLSKRQRIESHHIFPTSRLYGEVKDKQGRLYDSDMTEHRRKANELANRAIITPQSNKYIGNKVPSEYLPEVAEKHPESLERQFIPDNRSLWELENYEEFIANRRQRIAEEINQFIEGLVREHEGGEEHSAEDLVSREEGKRIEFKETLLFHTYKEEPDTGLRVQAVKEICSFMNTEGGYLIIGVSDDGDVKGIDRDLKLMENDTQKFEEQLEQEAQNRLKDPSCFSMYVDDFRFEEINGETICIIPVQFRPNGPVYFENSNGQRTLPVRSGSSARELGVDEVNDYIDERWE